MRAEREYLIVDIASGATDDFKALEGRMGVQLAASTSIDPDDAWWFASSHPNGQTQRIFSFQSWQRVELVGLLGQVTPGVRMSIGSADLDLFKAAGPGSIASERKYPPMLSPGLIDCLYGATGRRKFR